MEYFAEGDSITQGYLYALSTNYPQLYEVDSGFNQPFSHVSNNAVPVSTVTGVGGTPSLNARAAALDAKFNRTHGTDILSVLIGANDFDKGVSEANFLIDLATYLDARRAVGWRVVLCTISPRTTTGFNTWRNNVNTTLRTWVGLHADALVDFAADSTIGPDAAASDTSLYVDGTHPTPAAQIIFEGVMRSVVKATGAH